jgi:hypothetical protein
MKNISKEWTVSLRKLAGRPCIERVVHENDLALRGKNEDDLALRGVYGELYQYSNDGEYYRVIV